MSQVLPTCVAEVVCSEAFLNTWSDFWKKYKNLKKKKKRVEFKNRQMRKLQVGVTELIDFVAFFLFFSFSKWVY